MNNKVKKVRVNMEQVGQVAQQGVKVVEDVSNQLGNVQSGIDSAISQIVTPIAKMGNDAIKGLTGQDLFETDPTGIAEFFTESIQTVQRVALVTQMTIKQLLGLNNDVQKNLIQIGDRGDKLCDEVKGIKMTIALPNMQPPWGWTRWFDACIETETAQKVVAAVAKNPLDPVTKFAECAISEDLLKPIDNTVIDVKNSIADVISMVGNINDVQKAVGTGAQMITDGIEKFLAGSYTINPLNADTLTCFQLKMNGKEYPTVGFDKILANLANMDFIAGKKTIKGADFVEKVVAPPAPQLLPKPVQVPSPTPAPVPAPASAPVAKSLKKKYRQMSSRDFCSL